MAYSVIVLTVFVVVCPDDMHNYKKVAMTFVDALKAADLKTMRGLYSEKVILRSGSRLLIEGLNDKGEAFGESGDRLIDRSDLINAYSLFIGEYGIEEWKKRAKISPKGEIEYIRPGDEGYQVIAEKVLSEKADIFVMINRKSNLIFLQLRMVKGHWLIVSERWA